MIFNIEKLYLDCIDELGNCFIVYWTKAEFILIKVVYSRLLFCNAEGFTTEKYTLRKTNKPVINGIIHLNNKFLQTGVILKRTNDPIIRSLFKDSKGNELIWNCHHPKALAEVKYNGSIYKGLGYAETLFLPFNPGNLPIDELRWGRVLSESNTVIWINWKGKYPVNRMFLNGVEYNDAVFNDNIILFSDGMYQLKFSEIQIIRNGKLSGLLSKMRLLTIFFNSRILNSVETKYKAKVFLYKNSLALSNGWSIFEIVKWGK
jgi:hypothetical protein